MPIIYGREIAIMPTIIPMIDQIKVSRAAFVFPGSPADVKYKNPATKNIIIANPTNTGQINRKILTIICQKSFTLFMEISEGTAAEEIKGATDDKINNVAIFLFIIKK